MQRFIIAAILVIVGLVNFVPVLAMVSSEALAIAYGIAEPTGDLEILLRHRALLFGVVGGFIIASAVFPSLQLSAVIMAYISMVSFVVLVHVAGDAGASLVRVRNIDLIAIALLSLVPAIWLSSGSAK